MFFSVCEGTNLYVSPTLFMIIFVIFFLMSASSAFYLIAVGCMSSIRLCIGMNGEYYTHSKPTELSVLKKPR